MKKQSIVVKNSAGFHARPAKVFVSAAKKFESSVFVEKGDKKANAKSLVSILTLGVKSQTEISIITQGADEQKALDELIALVKSGMGDKLGDSQEEKKEEVVKKSAPLLESAIMEKASEDFVKGIAAAPGIAIGSIYQYQKSKIEVKEESQGAEKEKTRFVDAIATAKEQLTILKTKMETDSSEEAAIFEVHLELLEDPNLIEPAIKKLKEKKSAAWAWQASVGERVDALKQVDDPLLAARVADLQDISNRVLRIMMGLKEQEMALPEYPVVLVASDLTPSDTATLDKDKVVGIATSLGGPTSHTAILARALAIPAIVAVGPDLLKVDNSAKVILDGDSGTLYISPQKAALEMATKALKQYKADQRVANQKAFENAVTSDGHKVEVVANIGGLADAQKALENGAEGVGLLRTEFLFLDRLTPPTIDEQLEVYKSIATLMKDKPLIIRTLDIGGDKPLKYLDIAKEENPFLGERGIRLCLNRIKLLEDQLTAILKASVFGNIKIMFPMICDVSEWERAHKVFMEVVEKLSVKKVECGMMVEVPSSALIADVLAEKVDFFSIGTNDLTQYTLAVDRMNPTVAHLSDGLHPAVIRLIKKTVEAAHKHGKWVGVCGELGSDKAAIPILVGLGVDELSVSSPLVPRVKATIRSTNQEQNKSISLKAVACHRAAEVRELTN